MTSPALAAAIDLNGPGHYLTWGVLSISVANAVVMVGRDGRIIWVNDSFCRLTGFPALEPRWEPASTGSSCAPTT